MKIILLGAPFSGKGTLARNIMKDFDIVQISTGDLFRENIKNGTISSKQGKELFNYTLELKQEPEQIMKEKNMVQISDETALASIIDEVLNENQSQIELYHQGRTNMFDYFVGQVMKKTRGQANPVKVKEILTNRLSQ